LGDLLDLHQDKEGKDVAEIVVTDDNDLELCYRRL